MSRHETTSRSPAAAKKEATPPKPRRIPAGAQPSTEGLNPAVESGRGPSDSPTAQWWRVDYHLWAAGGRLIPTYSKVVARTAEQAIWKAKAARKRRDHEAGRANCGHFVGATAEPVENPSR